MAALAAGAMVQTKLAVPPARADPVDRDLNFKESTFDTANRVRAIWFSDVAALLADTGRYAAGTVLCTAEEGFAYVCTAAKGNLGQATAGGQELDVQAGNGTASVKAFGALGDGVTDDTSAIEAWISYMDSVEVKGFVPSGTYSVSYVRNRALTSGLNIQLDPEAIIKGSTTLETVAGDNTLTSLTVTEFEKGNNGFVVIYVSGGKETVWTKGRQYTTTGQVVNWGAGTAPHGVLAKGESLRVVSADPIIELGPSSVGTKSIKWVGGSIDNSLRGFAQAATSGSSLTLIGFDRYHVSDVFFDGGSDYKTNQAAGVTDSGLTTTNCSSGEVSACKFYGQADLGFYVTGGANSGPSDDTRGHEIHGNTFYQCATGGKAERQVRSVNVHDNIFEQSRVGWLIAGVASGVGGGRGHIHHNTFYRMGVRAVDLRRAFDIQVDHNTVIDIGYEIDGVRTQAAWAFDIAGTKNAIIENNIVRMVDLARATQTAFRVRNETSGSILESDNIRVSGNKIEGVAKGIDEDNAGTGNVFRENEILDTTTEIDVIAARRWHYRALNAEFEGIGTTPFFGSWTPELRVNDVVVSGTVKTAVGRYRRQGNIVTITCTLSEVIPGRFPSSGQIEIWGAPYTSLNSPDVHFSAAGSHVANIGAAGEVIGFEMPPNSDQIKLFKSVTGGGASEVDDTDLTAGTNLQAFFSMTYEVKPEAHN